MRKEPCQAYTVDVPPKGSDLFSEAEKRSLPCCCSSSWKSLCIICLCSWCEEAIMSGSFPRMLNTNRLAPGLDHIMMDWRHQRSIYRAHELHRVCDIYTMQIELRQDPPPPQAILVIFGRRALIFFCLKALEKKWKMTPLLCACAVVITLETQKCRKRAPRFVEFNFFINCDRHKWFSQNERRRVDRQTVASDF